PLIVGKYRYSWNIPQAIPVTIMVPPIHGSKITYSIQRRQPHRRRSLHHLSIGADVYDSIDIIETEVFHQPNLAGQLIVIGYNGAPFESVQKFRGVKAENFGPASRADWHTTMSTAESMGGIINHTKSVPVSNPLDRFHLASPSPYVHTDDAGSPG